MESEQTTTTNKRKALIDLTSDVSKKPRGTRLRRFVFTLNNYTKEEEESIQDFPCQWMIYGREIGENGTPHLQGACVIGKQMAFSTIKTWLGFVRSHIATMNGRPEDSLKYCSKEDSNPFQKGQMPKAGKRSDLHDAVSQLKTSEASSDFKTLVQDEDFAVVFVKYHKGLTLLSNLLQPARDRTLAPKVIWLYGPTGVGKTRACIEFCDEMAGLGGYWISSSTLEWFDGYHYQRYVVIDDLRTKGVNFVHLLRLLDRYQYRVPIKGGFVDWVPQYIFITAPMGPRTMWSFKTNEQIEQLERRITWVLDCSDGTSCSLLKKLLFPGIEDGDPSLQGKAANPIVVQDECGELPAGCPLTQQEDHPEEDELDELTQEFDWVNEDGDNVFAKE